MTKAPIHPRPADGIKAIQYSLRCFAFSFAALIPVLGLPFAAVSRSYYLKARAVSNGYWNPAGKYLAWGRIIGTTGLFITVLLAAFAVFVVVLKLLPSQYEN